MSDDKKMQLVEELRADKTVYDKMQLIKKLRAETELSLRDVSKAVAEADGDEAKARELLGFGGSAAAARLAGRQTCHGAIGVYAHSHEYAAMAKLSCETDFVARNAEFRELARNLAMHAAANHCFHTPVEEILAQPYFKDQDKTVRQIIEAAVNQFRENIQLSEVSCLAGWTPPAGAGIALEQPAALEECVECIEPATWVRHTQFAGDHPFCDEHARAERDFGVSNSTTDWEQISI